MSMTPEYGCRPWVAFAALVIGVALAGSAQARDYEAGKKKAEEVCKACHGADGNTPLTPETHHLIDAAALRAMKPTAYLINTARGGVVDETALIDALRTGQIRGAALDVFEGEPDVNPALLDVPGLVLTPHTASAGETTRDAMGILALDNAAAVLAGKPPLTPVR